MLGKIDKALSKSLCQRVLPFFWRQIVIRNVCHNQTNGIFPNFDPLNSIFAGNPPEVIQYKHMDNFQLFEELIAEGDRVLATKREPPPGVIGDFRVDPKLALPWVAKAQLLLDNMLGANDQKCKEFTNYSGKGYVSLGMAENAIKLLKEIKDSYGHEILRFKKQLSDNVAAHQPQAIPQGVPAPGAAPTEDKFPALTTWTELEIIVPNNHDIKFRIAGSKKLWHADYRQMDCENAKTHLPDNQWDLLFKLAEGNGQIAWGDKHASYSLKKTKQLLSDRLKKFFKLKDDPFCIYKEVKAYKTKFSISQKCDDAFVGNIDMLSEMSEPEPARKRTALNPEDDE